ncbi:MAG: hypothetical protein R6U13_08555 [Desulfatiglandaceae bacterium]
MLTTGLTNLILLRGNIQNPHWQAEVKKWLIYIDSKGELNRFISRLTKQDERKANEALVEISSAYVLEKRLKYKVTDWEKPTLSNKNVDFVIKNGSDEIYCEVKRPSWMGELPKDQLNNDRSSRKWKAKYINAESFSFGHWRNIRKAIKKAYPKFLKDKKNLVVIHDDLRVPILNDIVTKEMIDIALFLDKKVQGSYDSELGYFADCKYNRVGGILFIDINPGSVNEIYKSLFIENPNALIQFKIKTTVL